MKLYTVMSMLAGAIIYCAADSAWQSLSSDWAEGRYSCHAFHGQNLCFWIGEKRADGEYIISQ